MRRPIPCWDPGTAFWGAVALLLTHCSIKAHAKDFGDQGGGKGMRGVGLADVRCAVVLQLRACCLNAADAQAVLSEQVLATWC